MKYSIGIALLGLTSITTIGLAAVPTPPPQPTEGPGGSDYLYSSSKQFGVFYANPLQRQPYSTFYIFEPTGSSPPTSLPVVLFLHADFASLEGFLPGDSPSNYTYWIQHLVRKGYTVVFPTYDDTTSGQYTNIIINSWQAALSLLESGATGLIPPGHDSRGIQTVCAGHSFGAYQCFATAQQLTTSPIFGVPVPRAIAAFNPGVGMTGELSLDFSQISPSISVVLVDSDEDTTDIPTAQAIWTSIGTAIPSGSRDFLEVISDTTGQPAQLGTHFFPDTNGFGDNGTGVDDRDYNVSWKLSVGLFNCVLFGVDCPFGLGHGSFDQINMGNWSNGTPVATLSLQD